MLRLFLPMLMALLPVGCGSLIGELQRIKDKALGAGATTAGSVGPTVLYTVPADGAVSAPLASYIEIVYDQPIDPASVSGPVNGGCNGTAQATTNNFEGCGGTPSANANVVRISPNGGIMPQGGTILVQTTAGIRGTNGVAATAYTSPKGIIFTSPCGQDCFYSDSAPLSALSGNGGHSFVIPSGAKAGWILIVNGGGTTSTFWNPATNQTSTGPTLCAGIATGAHSFEVKTLGGPRSGKVITYAGGGSTNACTFDPNTETYAAGPLLGGAAPTLGAMTIPITTGPNAGQYLLIQGGNTLAYIYNVGADTYTVTPSIGGSPAVGAYWFRYDTGPQAGNPVIVTGNGFGTTRFYNETGNAFSSLHTTSTVNGAGGMAIRVNSGALIGKYLLIHGGGSNASTGYDQNTGEVAGPTVPCAPVTGAIAETYTSGPRAGQSLVLCGGVSTQYTYYDHGSNTFSALFSGTGVIGGDASLNKITSGVHAGKYLLVNGNLTGATSMLDPAQDTFHGSRLFRASGAGLNAFAIKSGLKAGRALILMGGTATTIYDPRTGLTEQGPITPASVANGSLTFPVTSGANAGYQYILPGASTAVHKYDPSTNSISVATLSVDYVSVPSVSGAGARLLFVPSGPQANNYLILNGGGAVTGMYFNTSTNTFTVGVTITGCASTNAGSWIFKINSGAQTGKYMIICGTSTQTSLFDPSGATFAAGPSMGSSPTTGAHGFYVSTGANAGKFIHVLAAGTATRLYDPNSNTWGAGPALCASAGAGGFNIPITSGANAGKTLVALGGGSTTTCYYDPNSSVFVIGPTTGGHTGYAIGGDSLAFPTGGGLYPSAYLVIHGALSTVFSHWFAY